MDSTPPLVWPARRGRSPLYDVTNRFNSDPARNLHNQIKRKKYRTPEAVPVLGEDSIRVDEQNASTRRDTVPRPSRHGRESTIQQQSIPEETAIDAENLQEDTNHCRDSTTVFNARSSDGSKTHIGPWELGKTLGKGSSGMVRLCRHRVTHELAAVKIVSKNAGQIVQAGSIYGLDCWDSTLPERINGERRIPMAIEREVAILKLIQHPNIMKLYDIWENRKEIYLVLEYVDHGDLFSYILRNGRLTEEGAMHFFRQIMSALSYCHAFNICHRDLKPENILLTSESQVKIADFSMAALHQTSGHRLHTACGSPHYAAPELLSGKKYRGDKADIWSMGIILYAMLASCLPFDDPDLTFMMELVKKGEYDMPEFLSLEAKDLIRRILQVDPDRRISMKEMWRHPLVQKYDYMDDYQPENKQPTDIRKEFKHRPFRADEIDPQLVRQLRSLWHMFSEDELKIALMSHEVNEQKMFYWLLQKYRERQLENFNPEIVHSRSDYHHLKPSAGWKERRTTCEFANSEGRFGRSVSRFTVISHVADTEEAMQSYDPYNSSNKPSQSRDSQASGSAKIIVHHRPKSHLPRRESTPVSRDVRNKRASTRSAPDTTRTRVKSIQATRLSSIPGTASSLNSIPSCRSSRQGSPYVRNVKLRHKRKVDFSQIRAPKSQCKNEDSPRWDVRGGSVYIELDPGIPRPDSGVLPVFGNRPGSGNRPVPGNRRPISDNLRLSGNLPLSESRPVSGNRPASRNRVLNKVPRRPEVLRIAKHRDSEAISREELRNFSSSLAKDCDDAFGSSLMTEPSAGASILDMGQQPLGSPPLALDFPSSPLSEQQSYPSPPSDCEEWLNRPLPPLPLSVGSYSPPQPVSIVQVDDDPVASFEQEPGEKNHEQHSDNPSHLHRLSIPIVSSKEDRRIASAPAGPSKEKRLASLFSSRGGKRGAIMVELDEKDRGRIVSYPTARMRPLDQEQDQRKESFHENKTIRLVESPPRPQTSIVQGDSQSTFHVESRSLTQDRPKTSAYTSHRKAQLKASSQEQQRPQSSVLTKPSSSQAQEQQRPQTSVVTRLSSAQSQEQQRPQTRVVTRLSSAQIEVASEYQQRPCSVSPPRQQITYIGIEGIRPHGCPLDTVVERESSHVEAVTPELPAPPTPPQKASVSSQESSGGSVGKSVRKKSTWFSNKANGSAAKGSPKSHVDEILPEGSATRLTTTKSAARSNWSESTGSPSPPKKRKFGLLFWKSPKSANKMSIAGPDYHDSPTVKPRADEAENVKRQSQLSWGVDEAAGGRSIVVHHNWLARLFRVKPVTDHLCFAISRKRARQEITLILRQWRKYGIRDIQVDRQRNIIFARVGPKNYLGMKEVALAVEIMAVIEHGNPEMLSIVRFTQERGAASTLRRVVATMREVFEVRKLLVTDKPKTKMMIKTLNA